MHKCIANCRNYAKNNRRNSTFSSLSHCQIGFPLTISAFLQTTKGFLPFLSLRIKYTLNCNFFQYHGLISTIPQFLHVNSGDSTTPPPPICTLTCKMLYDNHRRPKLTMRGVIYFFLNLYSNVQRVKRDIFTADIYYYITTEFGFAKHDLRLAAYGGVVLQRFEFIKVCMGKNGNRHYS